MVAITWLVTASGELNWLSSSKGEPTSTTISRVAPIFWTSPTGTLS